MKNMFRVVLAVLWMLIAQFSSAGEVRHSFLCIDNFVTNGCNQLIYVNQFQPDRSWHVNIPAGSRDIQLLRQPPTKALISHGNGAAEYEIGSGKKSSWCVDRYSGIQTAIRLANGNTLLGGVDGTIYQLDPSGNELTRAAASIKMNVRLMRLLDDRHVVFSAATPKAILEMTLDGKVTRETPFSGKAKGYLSVKLPNGNYLTSTGDECKIAEMDVSGKTLSFVGGKDEHPTLGLDFCSGWDLLRNGNRVMANWLGHGKHGKGVHLAEFTPENKLVWQWADHKLAKQITNVKMVE